MKEAKHKEEEKQDAAIRIQKMRRGQQTRKSIHMEWESQAREEAIHSMKRQTIAKPSALRLGPKGRNKGAASNDLDKDGFIYEEESMKLALAVGLKDGLPYAKLKKG